MIAKMFSLMLLCLMIAATGSAYICEGYAENRIGINVSIIHETNVFLRGNDAIFLQNEENTSILVEILQDYWGITDSFYLQPLKKERIPQKYITGNHLIPGVSIRCGSRINNTYRVKGVPGSDEISYLQI